MRSFIENLKDVAADRSAVEEVLGRDVVFKSVKDSHHKLSCDIPGRLESAIFEGLDKEDLDRKFDGSMFRSLL